MLDWSQAQLRSVSGLLFFGDRENHQITPDLETLFFCWVSKENRQMTSPVYLGAVDCVRALSI